jgi:hypothetical protein
MRGNQPSFGIKAGRKREEMTSMLPVASDERVLWPADIWTRRWLGGDAFSLVKGSTGEFKPLPIDVVT